MDTRKLKTYDGNKDFISELPDNVLVHILSFLPIEDVINTVLLQRFGDLWRHVPVLDLSCCSYHESMEDCLPDYPDDKLVNIIRHVLNLHDSGTLDKLCLKLCFLFTYSRNETLLVDADTDFLESFEWEKRTAEQIEKLIVYSIRRKVKVLDINLRGCVWVDPRDHYTLPDVFTSNFLTNMRLASCDIRSCREINLKSLRVLFLDEVSLSDERMKQVLVGCPFLEDLSLVDCYGLSWLNCENPNLKRVMLTLTRDDYLVISCPYVLSLEIYGWISRACVLGVSSVVKASVVFSCCFRFEEKQYRDVRRLLQQVSQCKTFSSCTWTILVLTIWNLKNVPNCPSFGWKNLVMKLSLTKWHNPGLSLLFRNSQSLETLTMYIDPPRTQIFTIKEAEWVHAYDFDEESYWESQEVATFPNLESIMIYGCVDAPNVVEMVSFLLKSASRLQKLVISTKKSPKSKYEESSYVELTSEQLVELSEKFKNLHRASPQAMIYFS